LRELPQLALSTKIERLFVMIFYLSASNLRLARNSRKKTEAGMKYDTPHCRFNPLTKEWVLVSPHRAKRPWLGQIEKTPPENLPAYDPSCYLCPGNKRAEGNHNPPYTGTFVFDNDFSPLLLPQDRVDNPMDEAKSGAKGAHGLFQALPVSGICRVVCFSPRHDLTLPELTQPEIEAVIYTWTDQTLDLGKKSFIQYVQVFENKGAMMGCSNPHPHSQIWSTSYIPNEPAKELDSLISYRRQHGTCLLCDYLAEELKAGERVVSSNDHFTALVPFWAVWPFELLVISKRHAGSLADLTSDEVSGLAKLLKSITTRYDNLFEISFPYSMGFHQTPTDGQAHEECHLHLHFYPPLLRSATVRKFMVGFEMLGMPQRDLTAETAAGKLRELSDAHYKHRN
jgi:UDPglucose--hexose-1-phosphate uridylyltransferase